MHTDLVMMIRNSLRLFMTMFLIGVLMTPSIGFMLYVHECKSVNHIHYNIESGKACCSHADHERSHAAVHNFAGYKTHMAPEPCCEDSQIFVKIEEYLTSQGQSYDHIDLYLISTLWSSALADDDSLEEFSNVLHSPLWPDGHVYLKVSSLRL